MNPNANKDYAKPKTRAEMDALMRAVDAANKQTVKRKPGKKKPSAKK